MRRSLLALIVLGTLAGALATACSSDNAQADNAAVLVALDIVDSTGFHHIDSTLNADDDGEINPAWLGAVRNARTAVATVEWPEDLRARAATFVDATGHLQEVLAEDDAAAAGPAAAEAHEAFHFLVTEGFAMLAENAGLEHGGGTGRTDSGGADHEEE